MQGVGPVLLTAPRDDPLGNITANTQTNSAPSGADCPFSLKNGAGVPGLFLVSDTHQNDQIGY